MDLRKKEIVNLITNVWEYAVLCSISLLSKQIQAIQNTLHKQLLQLMLIFSRPTFAFCVRPNAGGAATAMTQPAISAQQTTISTSGIKLA